MKMEYTAEVLRGWPADGARERQELIKQGSVLVNGDIVEMQVDGTVDKTSATANKRVGLVIRGNGDSGAGANANGTLVTPQPSKTSSPSCWRCYPRDDHQDHRQPQTNDNSLWTIHKKNPRCADVSAHGG